MIDVPARVKDALRDGSLLKNYRFNVLNDDETIDFTIDNDNLVSESVKFDERMATGNQLKFGLCEGSSLEFQYFNHPNITGRRIQAFIDVQYEDVNHELQWHEIPMGFFDVDQCPMQFSTGIHKVTAYNKLRSAYLDAKANSEIIEVTDEGIQGRIGEAAISTILDGLMDGYAIERQYKDLVLDGEITSERVGQYYKDNYAFSFIGLNLILVPEFSPNKIYKIDMCCKKIFDKIISYVPSNLLDQLVYQIYYDSSSSKYKIRNEYFLYNILSGVRSPLIPTYTFSPRYMQLQTRAQTTSIGWDINKENYNNENIISTGWYTNATAGQYVQYALANIFNDLPLYWKEIIWNPYGNTDPDFTWTDEEKEIARNRMLEILNDPECIVITEQIQSEIEGMIFTEEQVQSWQDVTLRELQSAVFEISCQYGQLDRVTDLFSGVDLNRNRLLPADDLYPANDLYPNSNSSRASRSMYSKLWTDSQGKQTFRYLIITYKTTEVVDEQTQEVEKTLQRTVHEHGTTDYNMSDNWLFKNLVWTAEQVGEYADAMVEKMRDISWFPFEMWCAGLPYLETGDEIEIAHGEDTYTSYILQRQLYGIQNLQDTYINGELDIF